MDTQIDRQTDRQTDMTKSMTYPHMCMVNICVMDASSLAQNFLGLGNRYRQCDSSKRFVVGVTWGKDTAASSCQENNTFKLGGLNLLHWQVVVLAPPYLQMLQHSNPVCKGTKANEALTGSSVPVSAVPVEFTSMVMVTQETTKMRLSYFKTERCPAGPRESFMVGLTWLEYSP